MNRLLTAKHWQIFVSTFGLLFLAQIVLGVIVVVTDDVMAVFAVMPIVFLLCCIVLFFWLYATGVNLHKKLPGTMNINLNKFKLFLIIPVLYFIFIAILMFFVFRESDSTGRIDPIFFTLSLIMFFVNFFAIFCIIYCFYFIAKALKSVELQRPVTFNDFGTDFILFLFYPVGVWFLQPRINKIFSESQSMPV